MSLKEVKSEILEESQEKADQIIEDAEEEAEKIINEAESKADKIEEEYKQELEDKKEAYEKKEFSNARMKAREERLKAKQKVLEDVFEEFKQSLENLDDEDRESYLENCMGKVGFEPGKVIGSEGFEDFVDVEFEEVDNKGVVIVSENGEKRQDFTFEKIVEQFRQSHRKEVAETVFEG